MLCIQYKAYTVYIHMYMYFVNKYIDCVYTETYVYIYSVHKNM